MARRSDHSREELESLALKAAITIAEKEGFEKLTARRLAADIGYTPGTLYNIFGSMDGLYLAVNAHTLDRMAETLAASLDKTHDKKPLERLKALAHSYMRFARGNHRLWLMVFTHALPKDKNAPDWYRDKVRSQFLPLEDLLAPLFTAKQSKERTIAARVLWSAVHGICFMEETNKTPLISNHTAAELADYLIEHFIAGLGK